MSRPRTGVALVSALVIASLVAALAGQSLWRGWRLLQEEQSMREIAQRQRLMHTAIDWAAQRLREDGLRSPAVDHLAEPWAQPVRNQSLEAWIADTGPSVGASAPESSVKVAITISDAQGRLNLLNLLEGSTLSPTWLAVFARLFDQLGLPATDLDVLKQSLLRASAATDVTTPGPAPLMPQRSQDLIWLGLSPASTSALQPHLVVLPGRLPVNLNTADASVLRAVLDVPSETVDALIERRRARPIGSLEESGLSERVDASRHAVASQFFEVSVRLELPRKWAFHGRALLLRQGERIRIVWRA